MSFVHVSKYLPISSILQYPFQEPFKQQPSWSRPYAITSPQLLDGDCHTSPEGTLRHLLFLVDKYLLTSHIGSLKNHTHSMTLDCSPYSRFIKITPVNFIKPLVLTELQLAVLEESISKSSLVAPVQQTHELELNMSSINRIQAQLLIFLCVASRIKYISAMFSSRLSATLWIGNNISDSISQRIGAQSRNIRLVDFLLLDYHVLHELQICNKNIFNFKDTDICFNTEI